MSFLPYTTVNEGHVHLGHVMTPESTLLAEEDCEIQLKAMKASE